MDSSMSRLLFDAAPSVPRDTRTPASRIARYGKEPEANFMFDVGQFATFTPSRARRSISSWSTQQQCAARSWRGGTPGPRRYFAGRTPFDHLEARELRAPVDVLRLDLRLPRPDRFLEPVLQREIVGVAPQEGHRRVRVGVHKPRDRGPRPPVDRRVRLDAGLVADG